MYIDSLTITALVVFIVALALFSRFCMMSECGVQSPGPQRDTRETPRPHGA